MKIDPPTLALMTALTYLALPLLTWFALQARRDLTLDLWCGGGLLAGVGWILASLYGPRSDGLMWAVGHACLIGSMVVRGQALRIRLALPSRLRLMIVLAAWSALAFCLAQWLDDDTLAGLIARLSTGLAAAGLAWLAWRLSKKATCSAAKWIALGYALMSLAHLALLPLDESAAGVPAGAAWSHDWIALFATSMIVAVSGHFGFAAMVFEREMLAELERIRGSTQRDESHRLETRLRQLDRQRDLERVAAALGHELSQPLAAIRVHAEVAQRGIARDRLDAQQLCSMLAKISANIRRSEQIVGGTSHFSPVQPGQARRLDLEQAVRAVWDLLEYDASQHGIAVQLRCLAPRISVEMDPVQFALVLSNLLRNAIEALADHAGKRQIEIEISQERERALVRISDSGAGLPRALLGQPGMPFRSARPGGLGLGLAVSASLLQYAQGRLKLDNRPEGGMIATVTMPVSSEPASLTR